MDDTAPRDRPLLADQIGPALDTLIDVLTDLRADLSDGDRLADVFGAAGQWRKLLTDR